MNQAESAKLLSGNQQLTSRIANDASLLAQTSSESEVVAEQNTAT